MAVNKVAELPDEMLEDVSGGVSQTCRHTWVDAGTTIRSGSGTNAAGTRCKIVRRKYICIHCKKERWATESTETV